MAHRIEDWLHSASDQWTLDIGCGSHKFQCLSPAGNYCAFDSDAVDLARHADHAKVLGTADALPFRSQTIKLVILHNSLEHIPQYQQALKEVARVLKPNGLLLITVPDGRSFSDALYRLILCGGGHVNRFSKASLVQEVEETTGLRLVLSRKLHSSFGFLRAENFASPPYHRSGQVLPRRIRVLGKVLSPGLFGALRSFVYRGTRYLDKTFASNLSAYGWSLCFGPQTATEAVECIEENGTFNVCVSCGCGLKANGHRRQVTCEACGSSVPFV